MQLFFQFRVHGLPVEMQIALPFQSSKPLALKERYLKIAPLSTESPIVATVAELPAIPIRTQAPQQKPTFRIRPTKGWAALNVRELWKYRDLLWILVERDTKLLYKQTALGVAWVDTRGTVSSVTPSLFPKFTFLSYFSPSPRPFVGSSISRLHWSCFWY